MKNCLLILFLFLLPPAFATVNFHDSMSVDSLLIDATSIIFDSEGATESQPDVVYVPIKTSSSSQGDSFNLINTLPLVDSGFSDSPSINVVLSHNENDTVFVHLAVRKSDDRFETIIDGVQINSLTQTTFNVTFDTLCNVGSCTLDNVASDAVVNQEQILYSFTSETQVTNGQSFDPTDSGFTDGSFLEIQFSSEFDSTNTPDISDFFVGDQQATLQFNTSNLSSNFTNDPHQLLGYIFTQSIGSNLNYNSILTLDPNVTIQELEVITDGNITITELQNGTPQLLALAIVNKFQFVSLSSNTVVATPQELQMFLEEKNCFLLSASFRRDDPLIDYFRNFRDQFLSKSTLGKNFIHSYYKWAPQYTPLIIGSPLLAKTIRLSARTIQWIIDHGKLLFFIFICLIQLRSIYARYNYQSNSGHSC